MTVGMALPPMMDCGAMVVDNGWEDLAMATSKRWQWGQWTANNDCHGKRQEWLGADDKGN
jgi:hypothetical protein